MKKTYKMQDLECANCAAKMENGIRKLKGVNNVSISFMLQKITIDAEDACFDEVLRQAAKICRKTEPDCRILL